MAASTDAKHDLQAATVNSSEHGATKWLIPATCVFLIVAVVGAGAWIAGPFGSSAPTLAPGVDAVTLAGRLDVASRESFGPYISLSSHETSAINADLEVVPIADPGVESVFVDYMSGGATEVRLFSGESTNPPARESGCPKVVSPAVIDCELVASTDEYFSISQTTAAVNVPDGGGLAQEVDWRLLSKADLPTLRLERAVRTYWSDGHQLTARERVSGPVTLDWEANFRIPLGALTKAATDSTLLLRATS